MSDDELIDQFLRELGSETLKHAPLEAIRKRCKAMSDEELMEQFLPEMKQLNERAPLKLILTRGECFMLLSQLQLALRHPENQGQSSAWARVLCDTLENAVSVSPAFRELVRRGWERSE